MKSNEPTRASTPSPDAPRVNSAHTYLDTKQAAAYLGLPHDRPLADLRRTKGGPRYVRIGVRPLYRTDWLDDYAEANAVTSTSAETARKR